MGNSDERLEAEIRAAAINFLSGVTGMDPPPHHHPIPPDMRPAFETLVRRTREAALDYANPGHMAMMDRIAHAFIRFAIWAGRRRTLLPSTPEKMALGPPIFEVKQESRPPHIEQAEVITSDPNGKHQQGKPLEVRLWINHIQPMAKACLSFTISNTFQINAIHAWAFPPEMIYGTQSGRTGLVCRLPSPRLNPGRYYLNINLSETPEGEVYERLHGACSFEIVADEVEPLPCGEPGVYQEDFYWIVEPSTTTH